MRRVGGRTGWLLLVIAGVLVAALAAFYFLVFATNVGEDYQRRAEPAFREISADLRPLYPSSERHLGRSPHVELSTLWSLPPKAANQRAQKNLSRRIDEITKTEEMIDEAEDSVESLGGLVTEFDPPPLLGWIGASGRAAEASDRAAQYLASVRNYLEQYAAVLDQERLLVANAQTAFDVLVGSGVIEAAKTRERAIQILEGVVPRLKLSLAELRALEPSADSEAVGELGLEAHDELLGLSEAWLQGLQAADRGQLRDAFEDALVAGARLRRELLGVRRELKRDSALVRAERQATELEARTADALASVDGG